MIFFTADTHFNHKNICAGLSEWTDITDPMEKYKENSTRPFQTLEQMNDSIIKGINREVQHDDVLYHLGDFAFGDKSQIPNLRDRINCNTVHLIMGNHDVKYVEKRPELYTGFQDVLMYKELRFHKLLFSLMHYPLGSWNEIGRGGINLHGHCHGNYTRTAGRQLDVGYDNIGVPMSIEEVYHNMMKIDPVLVDGHTERTNYG